MNRAPAGLSVVLALVLSACAGKSALPPACASQCVEPYGAVVGQSLHGVEAYSNCSSACVSMDANHLGETYTGMQWQCVEYARRWLLVRRGMVFGSVDIAADIWDQVDQYTRVADQQPVFTENYPNGSSERPQIGDLVIYAKEYLGTGHVAVVVALADDSIDVAEQNYLNQRWVGTTARRISMQHRQGGYWLDDDYLVGWKRVAE